MQVSWRPAGSSLTTGAERGVVNGNGHVFEKWQAEECQPYAGHEGLTQGLLVTRELQVYLGQVPEELRGSGFAASPAEQHAHATQVSRDSSPRARGT